MRGRGKPRVVFPDPPLLTPVEGPSLETSIFPLSFQAVREPLPFAYHLYSVPIGHCTNEPSTRPSTDLLSL